MFFTPMTTEPAMDPHYKDDGKPMHPETAAAVERWWFADGGRGWRGIVGRMRGDTLHVYAVASDTEGKVGRFMSPALPSFDAVLRFLYFLSPVTQCMTCGAVSPHEPRDPACPECAACRQADIERAERLAWDPTP